VSSNGKSGTFEGRFYSHVVQKIEDLETADGMKSYIDGTTERCVAFGHYSESSGAEKEGSVANDVEIRARRHLRRMRLSGQAARSMH
ncbi:MAG TPA: hypothetical protein VGC56_17150, partial [Allosphingosinicella sp.]